MISYDPEQGPACPEHLFAEAAKYNLTVFDVVVTEIDAPLEDACSVRFFCAAPRVPVVGERLKLEDGRWADVVGVAHYVSTARDEEGRAKAIVLSPTVVCKPKT